MNWITSRGKLVFKWLVAMAIIAIGANQAISLYQRVTVNEKERKLCDDWRRFDRDAVYLMESRQELEGAERQWETALNHQRIQMVNDMVYGIYDHQRQFIERVLIRNEKCYDDNLANSIELSFGRIVRVLKNREPKRYPQFTERFLPISFVQSDGSEMYGWIKESAVTAVPPEQYRRQLGISEGVWWDLPLGDKMIFHKAVRLNPGQFSEFFTWVIKERSDYWFYRPKSVQFQAWINGEELRFGSNEFLNCPDAKDFVRVRVQLSELEDKPQTIRFFAQRI